MLKRFALLITATAALSLPSTGAFAVPETAVDGVLPETLCHANIPSHLQPVTCGRGSGGPDGQY
jgi:hypothetical protein